MRWAPAATESPRYIETVFEPVANTNVLDIELYRDFSDDPAEWGIDRNDNGIRITKGGTNIEMDLTRPIGCTRQQISDGRDQYAQGLEFARIRASGYSGKDPIRVHEINVGGAM